MGPIWAAIARAWDWVATHHEPLTVCITLAGVVVAWRYVVLTHRLAKAANVQAGAARDQAQASRAGAEAAADQARVARQIFEAAHRPYLSVAITDFFYGDMNNFRIRLKRGSKSRQS
jgi:hypothetical protein